MPRQKKIVKDTKCIHRNRGYHTMIPAKIAQQLKLDEISYLNWTLKDGVLTVTKVDNKEE